MIVPAVLLEASGSGDLLKRASAAPCGGRLARPRLCDSGPRPTTHLTTRFVIDAGERHPTDPVARSFWRFGGRALKTARPAQHLP